jgi:hypothetical protein
MRTTLAAGGCCRLLAVLTIHIEIIRDCAIADQGKSGIKKERAEEHDLDHWRIGAMIACMQLLGHWATGMSIAMDAPGVPLGRDGAMA